MSIEVLYFFVFYMLILASKIITNLAMILGRETLLFSYDLKSIIYI